MRAARSISAVSIAVVVLALVASGCGDDPSSSSDGGEVTAVATTTQVADFVREVGGDRVQVEQILQPNSDPHGYEPRPSDVAALASADAIFQSGGELDEWLGDVIESSGNEAPTVELLQTVDRIEGGPHEHADGGEHAEEDAHHGENADPHWWQDPHNAIAAVVAIRDALIAADPGGRATYEESARSYTERLRRLDRNVAACIDEIPPAQRKLVTTHDALAYYADRYGIEVVGALIPSQSTAAQPSAGDTQELVDQIEREHVRAIFPESSINPKLERAVSRETGASVGRPLWSDTLGPADSDGATYIESIQSNTETIVDGLTGGAKQCRPEA